MSIRDSINEAITSSMKAREKQKLQALRGLSSAIKQVEIDKRIEMTDAEVLAVLDKQLKQRKDSIEQYAQAGRDDLVNQEAFELELIQTFMPVPLDESELNGIIEGAMKETQASSIKDMGRVMAVVKPLIQGRCDMGKVSQTIKSMLG